ncbi:MAG: DNA translocase FtsK 4TM domain-containing protein [Candidatus Promineifilaceae bacterium]|nr:DNA translocase FtsK 4TM domain-containing protein [Candidatus Promineifilaceae bacterium]
MARSRSKTRSRSRSDDAITWDENLIRGLLPWRVELLGLVLFILSLLTLAALVGLLQTGWLLDWSWFWRQLAGWAVYPLFLSFAAAGLYLVVRRLQLPFRLRAMQMVGIEMMLLAALPLSYQLLGGSLPDAYGGRAGGLVGWALAEVPLEFLGGFLTALLYLSLFLWGLALTARISWYDVAGALQLLSERLQAWGQAIQPAPLPPAPPEAVLARQRKEPLFVDSAAEGVPIPFQHMEDDPRLPEIELLEEGVAVAMSQTEIDQKKAIIEQTLRDFGLRGEVTEIRRGPSVTQFGVTPGYLESTGPDGEPKLKKVRVSRIASLRKDLALALEVPRLRIEAPVPGRGIVGLEVPNADASIVRLRTVLESAAFAGMDKPLAVALGQGVSGMPLALDIARMPHLLIAGTTGSGKSVLLNAFITCLVFNNTPEQLNLVMIDPKKVELIRFNGLPHLLGRVEVEHDRVNGVLRWLIMEMERRYERFAALNARNLERYNEKVHRRGDARPLPYIVVFIDELADLMTMYSEETEQALCRLAQMARATGIHLVVATQRPSTDVLTGLIKANFPARIAFSVASGTDSRVILDTIGAEQLLGRGDMLFLPPEAGEPTRVQGCFVSDNEIERVVSHWRQVMPDFTPEEAPWEKLIARHEMISETDDMLEEAIALAQELETISTSLIQRRLRVGFPRAGRLMEALYEMGLVEDPAHGGKTRRTLVDEDDDPLDEYLTEQL